MESSELEKMARETAERMAAQMVSDYVASVIRNCEEYGNVAGDETSPDEAEPDEADFMAWLEGYDWSES